MASTTLPAIEGSTAAARLHTLSRLFSAAGLSLIAVTWPLWTAQSVFPQVPLFAWGELTPRWVDALLLAIQVSALVGAWFRASRSVAWVGFAIVSLLSIVLDQHRLQVWMWHLVLAGLLMAFSAPATALRRLRWLTIGIYFWSALSKVDVGFVHGPGQRLLEGLANVLGRKLDLRNHPFLTSLPWLFVAGEALAAPLLTLRRTRTIGVILTVVMHLSLLATLGPWGLNHGAGVLLWNVLFLVQNPLLFGRRCDELDRPTHCIETRHTFAASLLARGAIISGLILPGLLPWGLWDVWPSWAVYSVRGGWGTLFVRTDRADRLPFAARRFVLPPRPLDEWSVIDIDAWSRESLRCPIYPQQRFRLAIAAALSDATEIRVELRDPPNRWSGRTATATGIVRQGQITPDLADRFWLNLHPRPGRD